MKEMYLRIKERYMGFKREKINVYVSKYIDCKKHTPLERVAPITPLFQNILGILCRWTVLTLDVMQMIMTVMD